MFPIIDNRAHNNFKYLVWLPVEKSSKILLKFCRGGYNWLEKSIKVDNNGKFEIFLGGVLNVHSGVWV